MGLHTISVATTMWYMDMVRLEPRIVLAAIWEGTYFALGKNTQPQVVREVDGGIS
jgi:hypothetical protein